MKKSLIISLLIFIAALGSKTCQAGEYLTYQEVEFEYDCVEFIQNYSTVDYSDLYDLLSPTFWGWDIVNDNTNEKVTYKKETLYVIVNEGITPITQTITMEQEEVLKRQYSVTGSIRLKGSGKDKSFSGAFEQKMNQLVERAEEQVKEK